MKSFSLFKLFLLAVFVISAEANTKDQINQRMPIISGGYKTWLDEVKGYDKNDAKSGYAGVLGEIITSIRISGDQGYRIHILDGKWLGEITGSDQQDFNKFAGTVDGDPIDGVAIDDGVEYAVHIVGGDWLPPVNGYDIEDSKNGYAGILGKPIDAIMIQNRTYAVSYTDIKSYTAPANTKTNATTTTALPAQNTNTANVNLEDNSSNGNTLNVFNILATILSISMI